MRRIIRWTVVAITLAHGLIHLMGTVKGFGWAEVSELTEPIGSGMAWVWSLAATVVVAAGLMLAANVRHWWYAGLAGAIVSQIAIATSWSDAKAGTAANVVLATAACHGYLAEGPHGLRASYRRLATEVTRLAGVDASTRAETVTEADLAALPAPVARYLRLSGAVGCPRIGGFRARIHGRIRGSATDAWMHWTGEQTNTYGPNPSRVFLMDATMKGLPADVLHTYIGPHARMQVRVASIVPIIDSQGGEVDEAETVTLLNDLCVLAPAALVDAPIDWQQLGGDRVRATFANAGHTVSAELVFGTDGNLVDFISDDRYRADNNGRTFTRQRWSTPLGATREFDGRTITSSASGRWHPADDDVFDYLDFHVDDITYLPAPVPDNGNRPNVNRSRHLSRTGTQHA